MSYKILLIANDPAVRTLTTEILELANYQVVFAADGKTGVEQALIEQPEIIVTETAMPGLDGYGVLHLLHSKPWFNNSLFIVLSNVLDKAEIRRAIEMGADDVIVKPFEGTELLSCLESRIKKKELGTKNKSIAPVTNLTIDNDKELQDFLIKDRNVDRYNKKQLIVREGERPNKVFYVLNGKARSFKTHPDGKDLAIDLIGPGDYIGYADLLNGSNYTESVETLDYMELAVIPRKDFEEALYGSVIASRKFMEKVIHRSCLMQNRLLWLAYHTLRQKVAAAILQLKAKYGCESNDFFQINLSRTAFASIAVIAANSSIDLPLA